MKVAAIDIGTNSTRLLVAETEIGAVTREITRRTAITRLGQGVHASSHLRREAIERTLSVIKEYGDIAGAHEVDTIKAVATSAMRDADNTGDLLIPAFEILKVVPKIIAGESEATLTYRGVLSDPLTVELGSVFLVIDIGGGSTEIIFGDKRGPEILNSLPLGCVRLTETFIASDPPPFGEITALRLYVRRILGDNFSRLIGVNVVPLAVAGTPTTLASIEMKMSEYDRERVHRFRLTRGTVIRALETLTAVPLTQRQDIIGLEPERADVIIAGAAILLEIMTFFDFEHVFVSERDILDGIALAASI